MNNFKLGYIVDLCNKYKNEEISLEELSKLTENLMIKPAISLRDKITRILYVIFECYYSDDVLERYIELEMNKFWYMILSYTDIELEDEYMTEENYDLLYTIIYTPVYTYAKNDIDVLMRIFNDIKQHFYFDEVTSVFEGLQNTDFSKLIEADAKLIKDLENNKEMIQNLADIAKGTNPAVEKISNIIDSAIIQNIKKEEIATIGKNKKE